MNNIQFMNRALVAFREQKGNDYARQMGIMSLIVKNRGEAGEKSRQFIIAFDKALTAAEDCNQAHALLCVDVPNPCNVLDAEMVTTLRTQIEERVNEAYAFFEQNMEDKDAAQHEARAFGRKD